MSALVIIDGGGTSTTAAVLGSGKVLTTAEWPAMKPEPEASHADELCKRLGSLIAGISVPVTDISLVVLGMSGIWSDREKQWYNGDVTTAWGEYVSVDVPRVVVMSDVELVQLAALGTNPGVVCIAGTGVMAIAITSEGRSVRVGGWGPRIDDAGGGFWMGREALRAVARCLDGRDQETTLVRPVAAFLRCDPEQPWALQNALRATSITNVARLAQAVLTYADEGDAVAIAIRDHAASEVSQVLSVAIAGSQLNDVDVVLHGSLWKNDAYRSSVCKQVERPGVHVRVLDNVVLAAGHVLSTYQE